MQLPRPCDDSEVHLIVKGGSYTPIKLAHKHTCLCILRYQDHDHDVQIDTRDAIYYRVPESPLCPMEIHLLSVHVTLLYILHTTMRLSPLYLLPLALTVLGQNQVP